MGRILVGLDLLSLLRGILWVPHRQGRARQRPNPSPGILFESVEDAGLESLEDHAIAPLDLTVSTWMFNQGPIDPDAVSITEV